MSYMVNNKMKTINYQYLSLNSRNKNRNPYSSCFKKRKYPTYGRAVKKIKKIQKSQVECPEVPKTITDPFPSRSGGYLSSWINRIATLKRIKINSLIDLISSKSDSNYQILEIIGTITRVYNLQDIIAIDLNFNTIFQNYRQKDKECIFISCSNIFKNNYDFRKHLIGTHELSATIKFCKKCEPQILFSKFFYPVIKNKIFNILDVNETKIRE